MEKVIERIDYGNGCPECGGHLLNIEETGETVCSQCGLVISERSIDISHDGRRAFDSSEKSQRERTGSPITNLVPDISLTTVIDRKNIENPDLKRAAKWDTRISWQKRNMLIATTELKRIAGNLQLPEYLKNEAIRLYKTAFAKKLLRGRSIHGMIAASLYYVCRTNRIPRTLQEILDETTVKPKDVKRCYRTLIRELKLNIPPVDPIILLPKYVSKLGLDLETEALTRKILELFKSNIQSSGKDPKGIVAGTLYYVCKMKGKEITQKEVANITGVTEVTLRSRYKELIKNQNLVVK